MCDVLYRVSKKWICDESFRIVGLHLGAKYFSHQWLQNAQQHQVLWNVWKCLILLRKSHENSVKHCLFLSKECEGIYVYIYIVLIYIILYYIIYIHVENPWKSRSAKSPFSEVKLLGTLPFGGSLSKSYIIPTEAHPASLSPRVPGALLFCTSWVGGLYLYNSLPVCMSCAHVKSTPLLSDPFR